MKANEQTKQKKKKQAKNMQPTKTCWILPYCVLDLVNVQPWMNCSRRNPWDEEVDLFSFGTVCPTTPFWNHAATRWDASETREVDC